MLTPREKSPLPEVQKRIKPTTLHHTGQQAQHTTHWAILALDDILYVYGLKPPNTNKEEKKIQVSRETCWWGVTGPHRVILQMRSLHEPVSSQLVGHDAVMMATGAGVKVVVATCTHGWFLISFFFFKFFLFDINNQNFASTKTAQQQNYQWYTATFIHVVLHLFSDLPVGFHWGWRQSLWGWGWGWGGGGRGVKEVGGGGEGRKK